MNENLESDNNNSLKVLDYVGKKLAKEIDINDLKKLKPKKRAEKIYIVLKEIIDIEKIIISEKEIPKLVKEIYEDTFGLGPISTLVNNDQVTEIMINNWNDIYIEESGIIKKRAEIYNKSKSEVKVA